MLNITRYFLLICGLTALGACMGGGSSETEVNSSVGIVVAPAKDSRPQSNGLPYAEGNQAFEALEQVSIITSGAAFSDATGPVLNTHPITFEAGFFSAAPTDQGAVVVLFGEQVQITNGEGMLANGQAVRIVFDAETAGDYAGAVQVLSYAAFENPTPVDPVNGEAQYIFGFMTDPAAINGRISGGVSYAGDITAMGLARINGVAAGDPTGTELDGAITVLVNFNDDWASANLDANYTVGARTIDVDLSMPATAFAGNTFAGDLNCQNESVCTASSALDAAFFGPNGEEIGGVISIDTTHDVGGDIYGFEGAGSFVIVPNAN